MRTPRLTPIAFFCVALGAPGCALFQSGSSSGDSGTPASYERTAKESYDKGLAELKSENWPEAIKVFNYTRSRYGYSIYGTLAQLGIADANMGREHWQEAIDAYLAFEREHPLHPKVQDGYASFRIGEAYYKQIPTDWFLVPPSYERDQGPVREALREIATGTAQRRAFLERYPSSPYVPQAKKWAADCTRRLAEHELYVANFYLQRKKPRASVNRLEGLLHDYPRSAIEPDVLLLLGRTYMQMEQPADARRAFERLVVAYPNDYHANKAKLYIDHIIRRWGAAASTPPAPSPKAPEHEDAARGGDASPAVESED